MAPIHVGTRAFWIRHKVGRPRAKKAKSEIWKLKGSRPTLRPACDGALLLLLLLLVVVVVVHPALGQPIVYTVLVVVGWWLLTVEDDNRQILVGGARSSSPSRSSRVPHHPEPGGQVAWGGGDEVATVDVQVALPDGDVDHQESKRLWDRCCAFVLSHFLVAKNWDMKNVHLNDTPVSAASLSTSANKSRQRTAGGSIRGFLRRRSLNGPMLGATAVRDGKGDNVLQQ